MKLLIFKKLEDNKFLLYFSGILFKETRVSFDNLAILYIYVRTLSFK